jgi:catechol 2,3-dioxygenase-like lactoylglutathione lyase family enzyme
MTTPFPALAGRHSLVFSHIGIFVRDVERMARFYKESLGFFETDRGTLGQTYLVFLSRDPAEHHQLVLASGRPEEAHFNLINQISLKVPDVATLRAVRDRVSAQDGVTELRCVTHGNAISIYFRDPEGNRLEVFLDTPWYCEQPLREPIDLDLPDAQVMAQAEALARRRPRFQPRAQWLAEMERRMGYAPENGQ